MPDSETFVSLDLEGQGAAVAPAIAPALQPAPDSPYRGFGGWLALFCVVQVIVQPVFALISVAASYDTVSRASIHYPSLMGVFALESIGDLAVIAFGLFAGVMLWRLQSGAVATAKAYLVARLIWHVLSLGLPFAASELPSRVTEAMMIAAVPQLIRTVIFVVIWMSYFNVSKRIKANFPETLAAPRQTTPLHWAARNGDSSTAQSLLVGGAEVNAKTEKGSTPLHWAADTGQADLVRLLLANGADVNAKDDDAWTPLYWATRSHHAEVAELLRQHGGHE
jgi:Ankyrin repeats (3 copies)/Protein of unknown function (DUF2569)